MSKAIVRIDIPTDYADEYKEWIIEGNLCYLEDGVWTSLKEVEYKVEPYRKAIPIEWIKGYITPFQVHHDSLSEELKENDGAGWVVDVLEEMIREWEKENDSK